MEIEPVVESLKRLVERAVTLAAGDDEFRQQLGQFAESLVKMASDRTAATAPRTAIAPTTIAAASTATEVERPVTLAPSAPFHLPTMAPRAMDRPPPPPGPREPLPELTLGRARPIVPEAPRVAAPAYEEIPTVDFGLVESRCRLKAEASRWAAQRIRRRTLPDAAPVEPEREYEDLIAEAKQLRSCFLWMCRLADAPGASDARLDELAACYDGLQQAAGILRQILDDHDLHEDEFPDALQLLAEVQSGVRAAFLGLGAERDDDQSDVFNWLKDTTAERQIYVPRYMRANDRAEPAQWPDRKARLDALQETVHAAAEKVRRRKKLFGKLKHKASQIESDPQGAAHEWDDLISIIDELINDGVRPSNRDLRTMLLPVMRHLPETIVLPRNVELTAREIEKYLESAGAEEKEEDDVSHEPIPEVREAAALLSGRTVVLIGGEKRQGAYEALKSAFQLRDLIWIETREHQSIQGFEAYVSRHDVAVVLLAIRWSSHSFGEVKAFCDEHDKLLVRLPGGYNPNQVALQILSQVSERLRAG